MTRKNRDRKILQVLDSGHIAWVQGGVFKDLRKSGELVFQDKPIYLTPPNSIKNTLSWIYKCLLIQRSERVLFSSLTPLENYARFPLSLRKQILGLWFTHKDGDFNSLEMNALKKCDIIFLHSKRESEKISKAHSARQVVILAAIDPSRFKRSAIKGKKVVWIGTPSERKNPDLFLSIINASPNEEFLLIGKGWLESRYALRISELHNLEYREIEGPLKVEDLDGCDVHIVTSRVEGGPMPLMECLAAGLMSISTDSGFVREIYSIAGMPETLIIPPDIDSFTKAIVTARTMASSGFTPVRDEILSLDFPKLIGLIDTNLA